MSRTLSTPPSINTTAATGTSKDEHHLLDYLDELLTESKEHKKKNCSEEDDKEALRLYRGNFGPTDRTNYFSCDFIQMFIDRMVAQLTDQRPVLRVEHRKSGLKNMAKALEKVMFGVWQEEDMQRQTYRMCHNAAIRRSAGLYIGYDHIQDAVSIETLTKDQVWLDPQVVDASQIDKGEYIIIERIRTLAELKQRFPGRGMLVKAEDVPFTQEAKGTTVNSPATDLLRNGANKTIHSVIGRTRVYEAIIKDRQESVGGASLFPYGRRIIYTRDMVLWDGPCPYWDGLPPIDWFDWSVDPEHPYGISAPMSLKRLQLAFNEILDGTVNNHVLSNFISVVGDADALDPGQWKNLQQITNSLILRKNGREKSLTITPPPAFGADKLNMAKTLFTYAQLLTGVTDVTLGEHPGSVQSGQAIAGLQEGANLMTRARASRLEDFYTRVGSKLMSRILQFWPSDRVVHLLGPSGESIDYVLNRKELFLTDTQQPVTDLERRDIFRYLRFAILPGSSAPGTRQKRAEMMVKLHMLGCASRKAVLQAADFADADGMLQEAEEDFKKFPPPGFVREKGGA